VIKVWGRKTSSNVQAVMWCLGELGLDWERIDLGHRYGGTDTPEFTAMNPNRTVPMVQDGALPALWETGAVLRYLAQAYGNDAFWPQNLAERTEVDRWAEWSKINIALGFTTPVFWQVVRTAPADQDQSAIQKAVAALEQRLSIADAQLSRNFHLAGDAFTLADIQFGHILYRYYDIAIARRPLPHLRRYYERLCHRSAYRNHVMLSYEELRVT
jgi:glutathione S-transferase